MRMRQRMKMLNARLEKRMREVEKYGTGSLSELEKFLEWKKEREVNKVNLNSCAVCDKRAERKKAVVGWALRCVGATASAAFHVALTVSAVYAVMSGMVF